MREVLSHRCADDNKKRKRNCSLETAQEKTTEDSLWRSGFKMNRYEYVIVGNSIAALSCIKAIREVDPVRKIAVVSKESHLPYSKVLLTHYIAGQVKLSDLFLVDRDFFRRQGVELFLGTQACNIDVKNREIELDNGRRVYYEKSLVATGASAVIPSTVPGGIEGITGVRTIEDATYIRQRALEGAKIAIWGGGLVGVKLACALQEINNLPVMLVSSPYIMSQVADNEAAYIVEQHLKSKGVRIEIGTDVKEIVAPEGRLEGVVLTDDRFIECQVLAVCKGVRPNLQFLKGVSLGSRGLRVDQHMCTEIEGVFAAGDVTETYEISRGEYRNVAIWPNAVEQGRVAGLNMAGQRWRYRGSLTRNALEILGLPFISLGVTRVPAHGDWDVDINAGKDHYRKLVYRQGKLVGAILVGNVLEAGCLQAAIRKNAQI
ncbi:FAD-dependent oxidoreductase [Moorellaceae bacterium AZ2]